MSELVHLREQHFELSDPVNAETSSVALILRDPSSDSRQVFKPTLGEGFLMQERGERQSLKTGVRYGETTRKEVAAYALDHDGFAHVPVTVAARLWLDQQRSACRQRLVTQLRASSDTTSSSIKLVPVPTTKAIATMVQSPADLADLLQLEGSLQTFVENVGSAEDFGPALFSTDEVHAIGILDVRLLNLDRNLGNLLVRQDPITRKHHLIPIDHAYTLPHFLHLSDVYFEWTHWPQCQQPFSPSTRDYILRLNPVDDAWTLAQIGIRPEGIASMLFATILLQEATKRDRTLADIALMVQRPHPDKRSCLENMIQTCVSEVHGMMADNGWTSLVPPASNPAVAAQLQTLVTHVRECIAHTL